MRKSILTLCIFLILTCTTSSGIAGSITFSDPMDAYEYTVYDQSGNVVGQYNNTDDIILNSTENYQIFVKPNTVSLFNEPQRGADFLMAYVPFGFAALLCAVVCLGIFVIFRRQAR
ncbi:hypothetical protein EFE42_01200 [Methanohalophilus sp. RSK]|uniref:hypothetical protein n=1 Tax=Methanohalophilus sp. RSK TaxID=2485783 RepID=UPI000F43D244|nr:hypothetical protein [Methanohalophilus sp. RSK]RNI15884.1 hypothetical protein EFE42_01200 [Methanohalophilus sp. RSK]